jgi:hypothetical protein
VVSVTDPYGRIHGFLDRMMHIPIFMKSCSDIQKLSVGTHRQRGDLISRLSLFTDIQRCPFYEEVTEAHASYCSIIQGESNF